jgi:hypothetical protein
MSANLGKADLHTHRRGSMRPEIDPDSAGSLNGRTPETPFQSTSVANRAARA